MKKFICAALIACVMCFNMCGCVSSTEFSKELQVERGRFLSDSPSCYVVTDIETGVQYLYCCGGYDGGVTVLVNADGTPCIADGYEK